MTTVVLRDDPLVVRAALPARWSLEANRVIVGEADDAPQALSLAQALDPDVVLLDPETPDLPEYAIEVLPFDNLADGNGSAADERAGRQAAARSGPGLVSGGRSCSRPALVPASGAAS